RQGAPLTIVRRCASPSSPAPSPSAVRRLPSPLRRPPSARPPHPGTFRSSSASHTLASESLGARQSPRGEREPPEPTFGPFGTAERLNWLLLKNRSRNTSSHFLIVERAYSNRLSGGSKSGQSPRFLSPHA